MMTVPVMKELKENSNRNLFKSFNNRYDGFSRNEGRIIVRVAPYFITIKYKKQIT